jgi:CDP-glucose 4,6-dehydratase
VGDVCEGYILLAEKMGRLKLYGRSFNFSNEKPLSVIELFKKITRVSGGYNLKPEILNRAKYEIRYQYLCAQKAKRILGWKPRLSVEKGLRTTLEWYREYFDGRTA